jgi:hypothetical protein
MRAAVVHGFLSNRRKNLAHVGMRPSVARGFLAITNEHEGTVPWPYLDRRGLVTTAVGNLIEIMDANNVGTGNPTSAFFAMPWKNASGEPASRTEMQNAFDAVKERQDLVEAGGGKLGGGSPAFAALSQIRLGPPGTGVNVLTPEILQVVTGVLQSFENTIKRDVPNFEQLPADAQLALLEHAWAVGPNLGGWPKLRAALAANDFQAAQIEDHQVGVTPLRDQMTRELWQNAIDVQRTGADPDVLYYPGTVDSPGRGNLPVPGGGKSQQLAKTTTWGQGLQVGIGIAAFGIIGTLAYRYVRKNRR